MPVNKEEAQAMIDKANKYADEAISPSKRKAVIAWLKKDFVTMNRGCVILELILIALLLWF